MERTRSEGQKRAAFGQAAEEMHERLSAWRQAHPEASFDEMAAKVSEERKALMGGLLEELSASRGAELVEVVCEACGGQVQNKGKKRREVLHREGTVQLERNYYYCPSCQRGFFPPGPESGVEQAGMEPGDGADGGTPGGGNCFV